MASVAVVVVAAVSAAMVGMEAVEVAWAPPDHPTARWEAKVIAVRARKAKVRFLGFDASWDTWLPHDSDELFPARAGIPSNPST